MAEDTRINYKKLALLIIGSITVILEIGTFIKMYILIDKDEKDILIMPIIICILTVVLLLIMITQEKRQICKIIGILSSWIPFLGIPAFIDMTLIKMTFSTIFSANIIPFMSLTIGVFFTWYFCINKPLNIKVSNRPEENFNKKRTIKYRFFTVIIIVFIAGVLIFDRIMLLKKINNLSILKAQENITGQEYYPDLETNKENIVGDDDEKINDKDDINDLTDNSIYNQIEKAKQSIIDKYGYDYDYVVFSSEGTNLNLDGTYYYFGFDIAGTGVAGGDLRLLVEKNTLEIFEVYSDGFVGKDRYTDNEQIIIYNNEAHENIVTFSKEEAFNLVAPGFAGTGFSLDEGSAELVTINGRECWRFAHISHKSGIINSYVFFDIYTGEYNAGDELNTFTDMWNSEY